MKLRRSRFLLLAMVGLAGPQADAEPIYWYSAANSTNLTSAGAPMTAGFRFELGVFVPGFTPTMDNRASWVANWRPAEPYPLSPSSVAYVESTQQFESQYAVPDNTAPFTVGAAGYIWGVKNGVSSSEWILFRNDVWIWPASGGINFPAEWNAADATAVIGSINGDGYLMKSESVTSWSQWQSVELAGEAQNAPNQDPDKDGISNLLEFVFGTPPKTAGPPPQTPVIVVGGHLQITIPRRIDRIAMLSVEVSSDLAQWNSGAAFTEVVSDGLAALIVRDKTAFTPPLTKRFMRLRASLP